MNNVDLLNGLQEIYDKPLIRNLKNTIRKYPDVDFTDALSIGQIKSKVWLLERLHWETCDGHLPGNGMVYIVGGWYGILAAMMFEERKYVFSGPSFCSNMKIRSFDWDPECTLIADSINSTYVQNDWQFKAITQDMNQIHYTEHTWQVWSNHNNRMSKPITEIPDVIINTACEHLLNFQYWWDKIPKGKLCVLQSNNFHGGEGHVNCVETLNEFLLETNFSQVLFSGELELELYTRFMIIGKK